MAIDDDLPFGLYEQLVTAGLKARLLRLAPERARILRKPIDPAESHSILARHIREFVAHALRQIPQEDRLARQTEVANRIIDLLPNRPSASTCCRFSWSKTLLIAT